MADAQELQYPQRMIDDARKTLLEFIDNTNKNKIQKQVLLENLWQTRNNRTAALQVADISKEKVKLLKQELKAIKKQEKALKKEIKQLDKEMSSSSKVVYGDPDKMVEYVQEMEPVTPVISEIPTVDAVLKQANEIPASVASKSSNRPEIKMFDPMMLTENNPPKMPCSYAGERFDELAGIQLVETDKSIFFGATSEQLRPFVRGRDYLECYGNIIAGEGDLLSINLEFRIASTTAQREYGWLEKNSILTIKLLNGKVYKFFCARTDRGEVNAAKKQTIYKSQFKIPINFKKDLMTYPVDQVRVVWSTGYEDYEVYEVDFIMNHLSCLSQKGF